MNRTDLIGKLGEMRCDLIRHGTRHDWYQNPRTNVSQPLPRHAEIKDSLARHIIKMLSDDVDA